MILRTQSTVLPDRLPPASMTCCAGPLSSSCASSCLGVRWNSDIPVLDGLPNYCQLTLRKARINHVAQACYGGTYELGIDPLIAQFNHRAGDLKLYPCITA